MCQWALACGECSQQLSTSRVGWFATAFTEPVQQCTRIGGREGGAQRFQPWCDGGIRRGQQAGKNTICRAAFTQAVVVQSFNHAAGDAAVKRCGILAVAGRAHRPTSGACADLQALAAVDAGFDASGAGFTSWSSGSDAVTRLHHAADLAFRFRWRGAAVAQWFADVVVRGDTSTATTVCARLVVDRVTVIAAAAQRLPRSTAPGYLVHSPAPTTALLPCAPVAAAAHPRSGGGPAQRHLSITQRARRYHHLP